jgi:hypothetical protein
MESDTVVNTSTRNNRAPVTVEVPDRASPSPTVEAKMAAHTRSEDIPSQTKELNQEGSPLLTMVGGDKTVNRIHSQWSPEQMIQAFKEIVTAILAIALVGFTLSMAQQILQFIGEPNKISDAKDILLLMLGLAGVSIGYYFGRIPADARATQAQEQAASATAKTEQVSAKAQQVAEETRRLTRRLVMGGVGGTRNTGGAGEDLTKEIEHLQDALDELDRLSRTR